MAMYSAYFDDSGHPDDPTSAYLVVAGCVASVDQWVHLERDWKRLLVEYGLENFHRSDFNSGSPDGREALRRFASIVRLRVERSVAVAIPLGEYKAINNEYILAQYLGFPYPLAGRFCMGDVLAWARKHAIDTPIEMVFEDGTKHKGQLTWIGRRDNVPVPIFKPKRLMPLQAADLVAGEIAEHLSLFGQAGSTFRATACLEEIRHTLDKGWSVIDFNRLMAIFNEIPRRDPLLRYECHTLRLHGELRSLIHCWPKAQGKHPKIKKCLLSIPPQTELTSELVQERLAHYELHQASRGK